MGPRGGKVDQRFNEKPDCNANGNWSLLPKHQEILNSDIKRMCVCVYMWAAQMCLYLSSAQYAVSSIFFSCHSMNNPQFCFCHSWRLSDGLPLSSLLPPDLPAEVCMYFRLLLAKAKLAPACGSPVLNKQSFECPCFYETSRVGSHQITSS